DATAEIMRNVTLAAEHIGSVASSAHALRTQAQTTDATARQFLTIAKSVSTEIHDLHRRLAVILRASDAGNRRQSLREPVSLGFTFTAGGISAKGFTADLSPNGALLAADVPETLTGQKLTVTLDGIGKMEGVIRAVSPLGVHFQFNANDAATE